MIKISPLRAILFFLFANTALQEKVQALDLFDRFFGFFKRHEQEKPADTIADTIKDLERKLIDDPKNPHLNYNLGVALYRLEKFDEAKHNFERAALHGEKASFKEKAYFNFANCLYKNTLSLLPQNWKDPQQKVDHAIVQAAITEVTNAIQQYDATLVINEKNQKALANKKEAEKLLQKLQEKIKQRQEQDQDKKQDKNDKQQQGKSDQSDKNQSSKQDKKDQNQDKQSKDDQNSNTDDNDQSSKNDQQQRDKKKKNQSSKDKQHQNSANEQNDNEKLEQDQQHSQDKREKDHQEQGREKDSAQNQDKRKDSGKKQPEREDASEDKQNNMSHDNHEQQKDQQEQPTSAQSTKEENQKQENGKAQQLPAEMQEQEDSTQKRAYRALLDNLDTIESKLQKQLIMHKTKGNQIPAGSTQKPW